MLEVLQEERLALLLVTFLVHILVIDLEGFFLFLIMPRSVSRGRSTYRTPPSNKRKRVTGSARATSVGRSKSRVRATTSVSNSGSGRSNATTRTVVSFKKKGSGKVKAIPKPKVIKVTKAFKKKVTAALSEKKNTGYLEQQSFFSNDNITTSNEQVSFFIGPGPTFVGFFSPIRVLDAASVLWNGKAEALDPSNLTGQFDNKGTKINVLRQWAVVQIKNNTLRKKHVTIRVFQGRTKADYDLNPLSEWIATLADEANFGSSVGNSANLPVNQNNTTVAHPGLSPGIHKRIRDKFKWTEKVYVLEPGQDFEFTEEGPAMTYDYTKYWDALSPIAENVAPTRWMLVTMYNDIVQDAAGLVGRIVDSTSTAQAVLIATKTCYRLEMPDVVGQTPFVLPILGSSEPRNNAVSPYNIRLYPAGAYGPPIRVDEQNPVVIENP